MSTQVLGRRLHIAVMLLALGVGLLGAFSKRYGWPLFLVVPAYGLVGTVIVHRYTATPLTKMAGTVMAVLLIVLGVVLFFVA